MTDKTPTLRHTRKTKLLLIALGYVTFGFLSLI
jgi:hypothetical protein